MMGNLGLISGRVSSPLVCMLGLGDDLRKGSRLISRRTSTPFDHWFTFHIGLINAVKIIARLNKTAVAGFILEDVVPVPSLFVFFIYDSALPKAIIHWVVFLSDSSPQSVVIGEGVFLRLWLTFLVDFDVWFVFLYVRVRDLLVRVALGARRQVRNLERIVQSALFLWLRFVMGRLLEIGGGLGYFAQQILNWEV